MTDALTLLRRFEPIVCYTKGEMFFPCAVDGYVRRSSLWLSNERGEERQIVAAGQLSTDMLANYAEIPEDHTLYLRFVDSPLQPVEYQNWRQRTDRPRFRAPGRLARVGLVSRILDGLFDLSLAIRGSVPGGTTARAQQKYEEIFNEQPAYTYYGRVVHTGGYIVLHYFYFYAMNDWRSSFYGVNDHEADWEQVLVYLADDGSDKPQPLWVAYATHDFQGDDLRRRWDDPELEIRYETHPVVYAGAGSHSAYYRQGEYLMGVEPHILRPIRDAILNIQDYWFTTLGQGQHRQEAENIRSLLSVPYIDYARGDGLCIGINQKREWEVVLLQSQAGSGRSSWVESYRGLWGLDTNDLLSGERAPAGPKFNRDGSVRQSWYDPLGWVGLDKVTPPHLTTKTLISQIHKLEEERDNLAATIFEQRRILRQTALETDALKHTEYLNPLHDAQRQEMKNEQQRLQELQSHYTELCESIAACQSYLLKVKQGEWGNPRAHLHQIHQPEPPLEKQHRLIELWAAISVGLLLFVLAGLLAYNRSQWLLRALPVIAGFVAVEAAIRRQLSNLLLNVTVILAIVTTFILLYEFFWPIVVGGLFILVIYMLIDNLRELSSTL